MKVKKSVSALPAIPRCRADIILQNSFNLLGTKPSQCRLTGSQTSGLSKENVAPRQSSRKTTVSHRLLFDSGVTVTSTPRKARAKSQHDELQSGTVESKVQSATVESEVQSAAVESEIQSATAPVETYCTVEPQPIGSFIITIPENFVNIVAGDTEGASPVYLPNVAEGSSLSVAESSDAVPVDELSDTLLLQEHNELEVQPTSSRKRKRHVDLWKQNVRIKKRNTGQSYVSSKNRVMPPKVCPGKSHCSCRGDYGCNSISVNERQEIFNSFWSTANFDLQNCTICSLVDECPVSRHVVPNPDAGGHAVCPENGLCAKKNRKRFKKLSRYYHIQTAAARKKVCKEFFLRTFVVSNGRLDRAIKNRRANGGVLKPDQRGKHVKFSIASNNRSSVVDHISMFPRYVSHYTRSHQSSREYLASNLNLRIMYRLYVEHCHQKSLQPVKESYYRHVFNTEFNLSFHQPLKDTCQKCDKFKTLHDVSPSREMEVQHAIHLRKAEKVRAKLNASKETTSSSNLCFTFDLQKTHITPSIATGVAYYKRQLATYNLGIHNLANNDATMFMWHEGLASRGASEIGSCIWKFVCDKVQEGATHIIAFCDSCRGQNRNFKIAILLCHCVTTLSVESFTVYYMQSGHSYLPNDADFGVIEKAKKSGKEMYIPQQWMELVRHARKQKPFTVVEMQLSDFIDLSLTAKQLINRKKASDGSRVKWLNIQAIRFTKEDPQLMKFRYVCDDEVDWSEVDLRPGRERSRRNIVTTLVATLQEHRIKKNKYDDLQFLKPYIPPIYHTFYDSLLADDNDNQDVLADDGLDLSEDDS